MKRISIIAALAAVVSCGAPEEKALKDTFADQFYIGAAINEDEIRGTDVEGVELLKKHFSSIVAENCMKSEEIHPEENVYNFELADKFVEFGEANDMFIIGCLLYTSDAADEARSVDLGGGRII